MEEEGRAAQANPFNKNVKGKRLLRVYEEIHL